MTIKGYLINLKIRTDRLNRFNTCVKKHLPGINIEVVEAVNGTELNLNDPELKKNVNDWNFKYLGEKTLRGIIGCCLSHLECYKRIYESSDKYAMIFEDDCYFINGKQLNSNDIIVNLKVPEKFGIIWFNKWDYVKLKSSSENNLIQILEGYKTMEAYLISNEYAKILYDENITNIGAIDAHIGILMKKYPEYPCYTINDDIFIQYNRGDSNIR